MKLLRRAGTRTEWQTVACAALPALNTTTRGCEIKEMRWRDVDLIGRSLAVRKSKTEAGEQVIPLNADAWAVILELYRRSQALGGNEPSHYLFPACETVHMDATRPIKSWRTSWRRLTRAIQCAGCGLLQNPGAACTGCRANIASLKSTSLTSDSRPPAPSDYRACRVQGERPNDYVDCGSRLEKHAPALLARSA